MASPSSYKLISDNPRKIVHLAQVLRFAWLHNTALWSHNPPGKRRKEKLDMAEAGTQKKSLDTPDESREFEQGQVQVATIKDFKVARQIFQPGWKWSDHVRPIAQTSSCQVRHTGYVISGQLKLVMDDRTETDLGPGDAYVIEPGHDGWVVGDEPYVAIDVSVETVEKFAKQEEGKGVIDSVKDRLGRQ